MKMRKILFVAAAAAIAASSAAMTVNAVEYTTSEAELETGSATVYDYGEIKLHAISSGDALGDEYYIVEGKDALVGIEMPSFTDGLEARKEYIDSLGKPMDEIFICDHATGKSYTGNAKIYGTQGAKDSITGGATFATTQGLYETFGDDFHAGEDMINVDTVVSGKITAAGVDFELIDRGETYDLVIPEMNVVYTHMLGKYSHSIMTSTSHIDTMLEILKEYQDAGYDMILSAHSAPEGQDAVTEKIAYVEKAKELAESSKTAEEFTAAMKEAFPDYAGDNYLEMTAAALYPTTASEQTADTAVNETSNPKTGTANIAAAAISTAALAAIVMLITKKRK